MGIDDAFKNEAGLTERQFDALMEDRKAARATRYGLVALLVVVAIVAVVVSVVVIAVSGGFRG